MLMVMRTVCKRAKMPPGGTVTTPSVRVVIQRLEGMY